MLCNALLLVLPCVWYHGCALRRQKAVVSDSGRSGEDFTVRVENREKQRKVRYQVALALPESSAGLAIKRGNFPKKGSGGLDWRSLTAQLYTAPHLMAVRGTMNVDYTADSAHTVSPEERAGFVDYINSLLQEDSELRDQKFVPLNPASGQIYTAVESGLLLAYVFFGFARSLHA